MAKRCALGSSGDSCGCLYSVVLCYTQQHIWLGINNRRRCTALVKKTVQWRTNFSEIKLTEAGNCRRLRAVVLLITTSCYCNSHPETNQNDSKRTSQTSTGRHLLALSTHTGYRTYPACKMQRNRSTLKQKHGCRAYMLGLSIIKLLPLTTNFISTSFTTR